MPGANLFDDGWRQGSLIRESLTVRSLGAPNGSIEEIVETFDLWLVASQDCDLGQTKITNGTRRFELRPLFPLSTSDKVDGIRTRTARVTDALVLRADSARLGITAQGLTSLRDHRENPLSDERRREIKTWLGLRYDRPAVPRRFEHLPDILYTALYGAMPPGLAGRVRDILVYYRSATEVDIFCVLRDERDRAVALEWLDSVGWTLSKDNGITITTRAAEDSSQTSLAVIETYYGLDSAELSTTNEQTIT